MTAATALVLVAGAAYICFGLADMLRSHAAADDTADALLPHCIPVAHGLAAVAAAGHAARVLGWPAVAWRVAVVAAVVGPLEAAGVFGDVSFAPLLGPPLTRHGGLPVGGYALWWMMLWHAHGLFVAVAWRRLRPPPAAVWMVAAALIATAADYAADPAFSTCASGQFPAGATFVDVAVAGVTMAGAVPSLPAMWRWAPCADEFPLCFAGVPITNTAFWLVASLFVFAGWRAFASVDAELKAWRAQPAWVVALVPVSVVCQQVFIAAHGRIPGRCWAVRLAALPVLGLAAVALRKLWRFHAATRLLHSQRR